jgi:hypothetical protein
MQPRPKIVISLFPLRPDGDLYTESEISQPNGSVRRVRADSGAIGELGNAHT